MTVAQETAAASARITGSRLAEPCPISNGNFAIKSTRRSNLKFQVKGKATRNEGASSRLPARNAV